MTKYRVIKRVNDLYAVQEKKNWSDWVRNKSYGYREPETFYSLLEAKAWIDTLLKSNKRNKEIEKLEKNPIILYETK